MECEKCFYNRKIKVWGETLKACYYKKENKKDLYEIDGKCSGFYMLINEQLNQNVN